MRNRFRWTDLVGLPRAIQFEAPSSWISRAALSQGTTVLELAEFIGWPATSDFDLWFAHMYRDGLPSDAPMLAGLEVARRVLIGYQRAGCRAGAVLRTEARPRTQVPKNLFLGKGGRSRYRFCPSCLHSDPTPFVRQEWRFDCWRYCPVHICLLEEFCLWCSADLEVPVSLVHAGPRRRGVADLSGCSRCGRSLGEIFPQAISPSNFPGSRLDPVLLANGRAMVAAMYHGSFRVHGSGDQKPLQHLRMLEYLTVLPSEKDGADFVA